MLEKVKNLDVIAHVDQFSHIALTNDDVLRIYLPVEHVAFRQQA